MADKSASGLTPQQAQEFHRFFMMGTAGFTVLTLIAHVLVWTWRPWF